MKRNQPSAFDAGGSGVPGGAPAAQRLPGAHDPLTYGVVLVAAVLVGGLSAWMPARRATRIDPIAALSAEEGFVPSWV